jgi:hypothetical protein
MFLTRFVDRAIRLSLQIRPTSSRHGFTPLQAAAFAGVQVNVAALPTPVMIAAAAFQTGEVLVPANPALHPPGGAVHQLHRPSLAHHPSPFYKTLSDSPFEPLLWSRPTGTHHFDLPRRQEDSWINLDIRWSFCLPVAGCP